MTIGFVSADKAVWVEEVETTLVSAEMIVEDVGISQSGNTTMKMQFSTKNTEGEAIFVGVSMVEEAENSYAVGDVLRISGELLPLEKAKNDGGFDEERYYLTNGVQYRIYPDVVEKIGVKNGLSYHFAKSKEGIFRLIDRLLPSKEGGIAKALLTGERDFLDAEMNELFLKAGINHILCVSGLHTSILVLYLQFFLEKILRCNRRKSAIIACVSSWLFAAFIGFTPSVVRAVVLMNFVLLGRVFWRKADWLNSIGIAACLLLLVQPLYLWSVGFQLSFVTALGIYLGNQTLAWKPTPLGRFGRIAWISICAAVFSFPLVAYHFYSISLIGVLVNIVALPMSGVLLGTCLLMAVGGTISFPLGVLFSYGVRLVIWVYENLCLFAEMVPNGYALVGAPSLLTIGVVYGLLLLLLQGKQGRYIALVSGVLFASVFGNRLFWHENTVTFLDVGQGDATVLRSYENRAILIDGGGTFGVELGKNTGARVILPYLEYHGISSLDAVFLTHFDRDHLLGVLELLDLVSVGGVYISEYPFGESEEWTLLKEKMEKNNVALYTVKEGETSLWAEGELTCLYPPTGIVFADGDENHGSLVLRYRYGEIDFLLMGDTDMDDERILLQRGEVLRAEVLKLGHHGSKTSSSRAFLEAVQPQVAIISVGKNNVYQHPHTSVLESLDDLQIQPYRTDLGGSIAIAVSPKGEMEIAVQKERVSVYERIKETMEK